MRFLSIPENQQLFYRLKSEKVIIEEEAINVKKVAKELETKWVSLTETHGQVIERINKGGFSFDEFERLREKKTLLEAQCHSLTKENQLAQKAAKKWRNKFDKLKYFYRHSWIIYQLVLTNDLLQFFLVIRNEYEKCLEGEMTQLRQSVQMQIKVLRLSGTEHLEERLLEVEQGKGKALHEARQLEKQ